MGAVSSAMVIRIPAPPTSAAGPNTEKIAAPIAVPAPSITKVNQAHASIELADLGAAWRISEGGRQ